MLYVKKEPWHATTPFFIYPNVIPRPDDLFRERKRQKNQTEFSHEIEVKHRAERRKSKLTEGKLKLTERKFQLSLC